MIRDTETAAKLAARQDPDSIPVIIRACGELRSDRAKPVQTSGASFIDLAGACDFDTVFNHPRAYAFYDTSVIDKAPIWAHMESACKALANELGEPTPQTVIRQEIGST